MVWLNISSVSELKNLGNLRTVQKVIKADLENYFKCKKVKDKNIVEMIKITSNSWQGLFEKIIGLREFIDSFSGCENIDKFDRSIEYFKSEEEKIIFALLELEGRKRNDMLGITRKCFMNEAEAKKWRNNLSKKIHPDKSKNKYADKASSRINQLYTEMVGHE